MQSEIQLSVKALQENIQRVAFTINDETKEEKTSRKSKKIKVILSIVCGNLFLGCCYSLMAPFFPQEAEKKNASATVYGFVFGIYELTMFLSAPVYGKIIPILKPRFMMNLGMVLSGTCNILFGLLDYAPAGPTFIGLAITLRLFDALGAAACITSSFTILASELPEFIGRAMSLAETAYGCGMAGGPVLGGFLYQIGGFRLPFIVIGLIVIITAVFDIFLISKDDSGIPSLSISSMQLIANTDFLIDVISIGICFIVVAFNAISLEPHLRQFSLSPVSIGLIFSAFGLTAAVCMPIWGYFAEKVSNAQYLTFLGTLFVTSGYLIIGPASFLNFGTILWVVILSQFLLGLGLSSLIVCSLTHGMKHTVERGFPNEIGTYSVISGIMFSATALGGFIGPSVGGFLIDKIGYIKATVVAAGLGTIIAFLCAGRVVYLCLQRSEKCC